MRARCGILITILFLTLGNAQSSEFLLDPVHTQILFYCDHLGFSKSQGEFLRFQGNFSFDPNHPQNSSAMVNIDTASIEMDNEKWNEHMRNKDFFDVENYPTITFKSSSIELLGQDRAKVHGDLTILGKTHPVTLNVKYNKSGVHPFSGKYIAGFSATTTVKRSQYGMTYGLPALGDDIEIRLEIEGERIKE